MKKVYFFLAFLTLVFTVNAAQPVKYIALTYDDGPTRGVTANLLEVLDRHYVPATFFLCGYRMAENPDLVAQLEASPHTIAIHGYSHQYATKLSPQELEKELVDTISLLQNRPQYYRPPGGLLTPEATEVIASLGLTTVLWDVDPVDWCCHDPNLIASRVISQAKDGAIILMHDLNMASVQATEIIIETLESQGYQFVPAQVLLP